MEWQPIETAPMDGTTVLLYPLYSTGWWEQGDERWLTMVVPINRDLTISEDWENPPAFYCVSVEEAGKTEPTHWMPLPAPPGAVMGQ